MGIDVDARGLLEWWSRRRREKLMWRIRHECPHVEPPRGIEGAEFEGIEIRFLFESPPRTALYLCHLCGAFATKNMLERYSQSILERLDDDPQGVIDDITRRREASLKLVEKLCLLGGPVPEP